MVFDGIGVDDVVEGLVEESSFLRLGPFFKDRRAAARSNSGSGKDITLAAESSEDCIV